MNEVTYRDKQRSTINSMVSDGITYSDPTAIAKLLNRYFTSIATFLASKLPYVSFPDQKPAHYQCSEFTLQDINNDFVYSQLSHLKRNKGTGLDNISARFIKISAEVIATSVSKLLNLSLRTRTFPKIWKCAKVTALFKCGNRNDVSNYRPISVLPTLSKLLEKAVHVQLSQHLVGNNLFTNKQHGFRPRRSTSSALINFSDGILTNVDKGNLCGAVFLDLAKAFDTVDHQILTKKLQWVGVCNNDIQWFISYLHDRSQRTVCSQQLSDSLPVAAGVPQGSILRPLLFILMICQM